MLLGPREVYLDHNATTPVSREAQIAMERVLERTFGNASSLHTHGRRARGLVESARRSVASLLACRAEQVVFTSGATEGNNAVLKGVFFAARQKTGSPGHIVTSKIEHESVLGACKQIEDMGGRVTYIAAGRNGIVRPEDVDAAMEPDTVLVSIIHANNETGAVEPVRQIADIAHARGAAFHTDAAQSYGKIPTRVDNLGCDFLTLTAHKIYGPKGAGAMFVRGNTPFFPLVTGGDQERGLRAGTESVHQIAGLGAAADVARERMQGEQGRLRELRVEFLENLRRAVPNLIVHEADPKEQLPGTMSLAFPGAEGLRLLAGLDCWEVSASIGSACTEGRVEPSHVMLGMGIGVEEALSTIRMGMGAATTSRDMKYVVEVLVEILSKSPKGLSYLDPELLVEEKILSPRTFLVDLRLPYERWISPSIPSAREWSVVGFDKNLHEIPREQEVILVCGTGVVSHAAGYRLAHAGHPRVRVVHGGYAAWRARFPDLLAKLKQRGG